MRLVDLGVNVVLGVMCGCWPEGGIRTVTEGKRNSRWAMSGGREETGGSVRERKVKGREKEGR
jgi:hypothetical protein